jgi:hypothetical protein
LIVKISLNSPEFSGKTHHKGEIDPSVRAHKGCVRQRFIPSAPWRLLAGKNSSIEAVPKLHLLGQLP